MSFTVENIMQFLDSVKDPEIPAMSVIDMGIVRNVEVNNNDFVRVTITPTYSGCPAMRVIEDDIKKYLFDRGVENLELITALSPAWTTDWMSEEAKLKLKSSGIAPPIGKSNNSLFNMIDTSKQVECPYCNSINTRLESYFGSTACKSLHFCLNCQMPFDHFKCH